MDQAADSTLSGDPLRTAAVDAAGSRIRSRRPGKACFLRIQSRWITLYTRHSHWCRKSPMSKEKIVNFRIDGQVKKQAKRLAEADGRSLSNWITRLIEREIAQADRKS